MKLTPCIYRASSLYAEVFEYCAREAAQIFGGASYVRGGQGEKVERLYRDVRAYAIPVRTGRVGAPSYFWRVALLCSQAQRGRYRASRINDMAHMEQLQV